jgi:hypothetical protein
MPKTIRLTISISLAAVVIGAAALPSTSGASGSPVATASKACSLKGQYRHFPPASYVTSLHVRHTTCARGKKVIRAYHRCRANHGGANGQCPNRVFGFRCKEGKRQRVPGVQYNATVHCSKGIRRVTSTYTQNI